MKKLLILAVILIFSTTVHAESASSIVKPSHVNLLFIAKVILSAVIVFVGISALRSFLRHEEK